MEWVELGQREVVPHGSRGVRVSEVARLGRVDGFAVHLASIAAGGVAGRHPAPIWQLFVVVTGSGWVAGADGVRQPTRLGEAVLWEPGEEHESGSDEGMLVVITEAPMRLPYGE
jgi:quercetin dioxygenase-like cupin family protein